MAASSSENSTMKPSLYHDEDIIPSFEDLGLSNTSFGCFSSQESLNNRSSSSSSENNQEEKGEWSRIMEEPLATRYGSNAIEWPSRSYSPSRNIWALETFTSGEKSHFFVPENFYEGLRGETSINACNSWNQFGGRSYNACYNLRNGDQQMGGDNLNALRCQNGAGGCSYRTGTNVFVTMAKTQKGSLKLQRMIKHGTPMEWQEILDGVLECIFEVMTDEYGHHLFLKLVEYCNSRQFQTIFVTLASNEDLLINASLLKHGSSAIQGFIKKLKKTGLGHSITLILSKRFVELMTNEQGRYVVQQCFYSLKTKENEVLFSCVAHYFKELATTEYGCSSLNACLSCICGVQRMQLLENIADESDFLANDPWGHFVVQQVLMLKNNETTCKICDRLKMQYIHLAQKKSGSHVVEKCIQASEYGMKSVVESLLGSEKALLQLACDQFGNYVIQTALKTAKTYNIKLYELLVAVLKAHNLALSSSTVGRYVNNLIKELENSKVEKTTQF